jgi:hypothetical protein
MGSDAREVTPKFGRNLKRSFYGYEPTREAAMAAFAKSWRARA